MIEAAENRQYPSQPQGEIVPEIDAQTAGFVDTGSKLAVAGICGHFDDNGYCRRITLGGRCREH